MPRIAVFDPFSGASGDMILGALVDAGAPLGSIEEAVVQLGLRGARVTAEPASSGAVRGTRVRVETVKEQPSRDWREIRALIADSALEAPVRDQALAVFAALAKAESEAHREPIDRVHFHEVGAVDAIIDIVGACIGLHALGVEQIVSHPVTVGTGWVRSDHGLLPVPAPATVNLLAGNSTPIRPDPPAGSAPGELLTPTGAAILVTLASWTIPAYTPERVGHGFGTRQLPWPNALRLWIGEATGAGLPESEEYLLETNIDDMNPQFFEPLSERLFAAGALDVWLTPVTMKKGRPATVVSAIVPAERRANVERVLFLESTTIGVRATLLSRTRAHRRFETITTRWGDVRLKLRGWEGRVIGAMPEYDDCFRLSRESDASIREIWAEAHRLGEVFTGQRWEGPAQVEGR
ncbi:MAG: nickel pincer cofactor biosynthesis protein LarC [Chloroflexi bacterium]|nr:nickel pincer cofactor biosynthesis protein LarC [Chloroflexota bacterium]